MCRGDAIESATKRDRVTTLFMRASVVLGAAQVLVAGFCVLSWWWKWSLTLLAIQLACLVWILVHARRRPTR